MAFAPQWRQWHRARQRQGQSHRSGRRYRSQHPARQREWQQRRRRAWNRRRSRQPVRCARGVEAPHRRIRDCNRGAAKRSRRETRRSSVRGTGKTTLVKALGLALNLSFNRIQFTVDLMPADITGTRVILSGEDGRREFTFQPGPAFCHILLGDEINRATPKTQSALLEAMAELQVTVSGTTYKLEPPYFVMATLNPIEMEGTYPLPEAQLDRLLFKVPF